MQVIDFTPSGGSVYTQVFREYTVEDTGGKVDSHHIGLYMPRQADAKRFGRQRVKVVVLKTAMMRQARPMRSKRLEAKA